MKVVVLIVAAFVEAYLLLTEKLKESDNLYKKAFLGVRVAIICGLVYFSIVEILDNELDKNIRATNGVFGDQKDAKIDFPIMKIGNINGQNNNSILRMGNEKKGVLSISKQNGQIYVYCNIRDCKGDIIAMLNERTWDVTNTDGIDYNNDDSAFEIITGSRVVFQLVIKTDTAFANGIFCSEQGYCAYVSPTEGLAILGKSASSSRFNFPNEYDIPKLFKYPRYKYYGVRDNSSAQENIK